MLEPHCSSGDGDTNVDGYGLGVEWERGRAWSCSRGGFTTGGADTSDEMYLMMFLMKFTLMLGWAGLVSVWQSLGMAGSAGGLS